MARYLTCEADIDFPVPNIHQLTAQLRTMYDGQTPVTTRALAHAFGLVEGAIVPVLRRAEQCELVRNIDCHGWIPLQS
jgi:hypothetical protein